MAYDTKWTPLPGLHRSGRDDVGGLGVAGDGLVMPQAVQSVLPVPTRAAEVLEAVHIATEIRPLLGGTQAAYRVFQVRVYLDLEVRGILLLHKTSQ